MKQRLARARALVAVKSYSAASFELEKIRKESGDPSVQNIALMLLMNSYLENGDYKRTQEILGETFGVLKSSQGASSSSYFTVSGQVVKMARGQMERYKQLGLNVSDSNIPAEAVAELDKMRGTLEVIVNQIKELGDVKNKRSGEAFGLLEEVTNTRSAMARDAYDATRWKNEVADARERIAYAQNSIVHVVDEPAGATTAQAVQNTNTIAAGVPPLANAAPPLVVNQPNVGLTTPAKPAIEDILVDTKAANNTSAGAQNASLMKPVENKPAAATGAGSETAQQTPMRPRVKGADRGTDQASAKPAAPAAVSDEKTAEDTTTLVGSLVEMATKRVNPVYPPTARNMRVTGVVRVDLMVDEQGAIVKAEAVQGPEMLKRAALDAVKQWKFKPVVRDGQPTRAQGFINFNFSL